MRFLILAAKKKRVGANVGDPGGGRARRGDAARGRGRGRRAAAGAAGPGIASQLGGPGRRTRQGGSTLPAS